tara:strand:- start:594 stop:1550 length:957 start_codon:yes stop_codon:yes gene_type:complete
MEKFLLLLIVPFFIFSQEKIPMQKKNGVWMVPGTINGLSFNFVFDTGSSDVFVSSDILNVMIKQGTVTENDILEIADYLDASGNINEATKFIIKEIKIGSIIISNVLASASNSINTPLLLGQSFLSKFPSFTQTRDGYLILGENSYTQKNDNNVLNNLIIPLPDDRIGFISNPSRCPFGLNYYHFFSLRFAWYIDYRDDFAVTAPGEWALRGESWIVNEMGGYPTGILEEGGYNVLNIGLAYNFSKIFTIYFGGGASWLEMFQKYNETYTGPYYSKYESIRSFNLNYGILLNTKTSLSFQIGFDSSVPGINAGINFTI